MLPTPSRPSLNNIIMINRQAKSESLPQHYLNNSTCKNFFLHRLYTNPEDTFSASPTSLKLVSSSFDAEKCRLSKDLLGQDSVKVNFVGSRKDKQPKLATKYLLVMPKVPKKYNFNQYMGETGTRYNPFNSKLPNLNPTQPDLKQGTTCKKGFSLRTHHLETSQADSHDLAPSDHKIQFDSSKAFRTLPFDPIRRKGSLRIRRGRVESLTQTGDGEEHPQKKRLFQFGGPTIIGLKPSIKSPKRKQTVVEARFRFKSQRECGRREEGGRAGRIELGRWENDSDSEESFR